MQEVEAVVDRIVDGEHVVLLVGPSEREWIVPRSLLPEGLREGLWLRITCEGDRLARAVVDNDRTDAASRRIEAKLNLLRQRGRPRE